VHASNGFLGVFLVAWILSKRKEAKTKFTLRNNEGGTGETTQTQKKNARRELRAKQRLTV